MKIQELKRGERFRVGKQKKFREFLDLHLLNGDNIPLEHKGKLLVIYDNCKQMICDPDVDVEVEVNFLEPVKGYDKSYSTGIEKMTVEIDGKTTSISHFLKDGNRLAYIYCIMNSTGDYVDLDVRRIKGFPEVSFDAMAKDGINILFNHILKDPNAYSHFV